MSFKKKITVVLFAFVSLTISCTIKKQTEQLNFDTNQESYNEFYSNGNYNQALIQLTKLIGEDSLNGEYFFKRAVCYLELDNLNLSELDFGKAANLNYRKADSYYNLAVIQSTSHRDSLAKINLKKALLENPDMSDAKELLEIITSH